MKVILYHYVKEFDPYFPNLRFLHYNDFEKQIIHFKNKYGFVKKEDFLNSIQSGKNFKGVVLTFDDGLNCHFEYVLPILEKYNLFGIFYISTYPLESKELLNVHKVHCILANAKGSKVLDNLNDILQEEFIDRKRASTFRDIVYKNQKINDYEFQVKKILNYYIKNDYVDYVIDELFKQSFPEKDRLFSNFYLSKNQILTMHKKGMMIGNHSVKHRLMSTLGRLEQEIEIKESFNSIEKIIGKVNYKSFCFPYGGPDSFNHDTIDILKNNSTKFGFSIGNKSIKEYDLKNNLLSLPRYDCNQYPHGQIYQPK